MSPPPCVPILKAKLNFSLKWGMWPVAERCPSLVRKSPPPTQQSGVRGCWPQKSFKYFTCNRSHLMCQEARHICKNPRGQLTGCPAQHVAQWDGRKAANWQTVNSSLASSSTSHTASPWSKCSGGISDWCLLLAFQASHFSESRKQTENDLKFTKFISQYPGEEWSVRTAVTPKQSQCLASPHLSCHRTATLTH